MSKVPIIVVTHEITRDGVAVFESQKVIDHANSSDRKWLGTHCFWAFRNHRMVTTSPFTERPGVTTPNIGRLLESN